MNSESKTTEDILREMREYADQLDNDGDITGADFRDFANQIEQAIARDTIRLSDGAPLIVRAVESRTRIARLDAEYVGYRNMVAVINALQEIRSRLVYLFGSPDGTFNPPAIKEICEIADDALFTPPRNCDVGTAKEQEERFDEFCSSHFKHCSKCPLFDKFRFCQSAWMQLPYEKEGAPK